MTDQADEPPNVSLYDEPTELDFLPDLAERLATLRRANLALERARVLLEKAGKLMAQPPPAPGDDRTVEPTAE